MAAGKLDITLEEYSDFTKTFTYKDANGNAIDVTGYGARIVLSESAGTEPFFDGDNVGGFVSVGTTNGQFVPRVPYTKFSNKNITKGLWELYIYPTSGDFTDRPKKLIRGEFRYERSLIKTP